MKGIVFNLLQEIVIDKYGDDTWDALLESAGVAGTYTSLGNYDDAELGKLVTAASEALGVPPAGIVRWVGRMSMPKMAQRFPGLFESHSSARSFLLTLNDIIHPEVRKLYPGANVPDFIFHCDDSNVVVMEYRSERKMCAFALGLIDGAGDHYGEPIATNHSICMLEGADHCRIELTFVQRAA